MGAISAASLELAVDYNTLLVVQYAFEQKRNIF